MTHIATQKQFSRNLVSGWVMLVAEVGVAFLLTPFLIFKLGAATYGIWSLMIGVIGYMGLVDIGIRGSVGRYINHYMALKDQRAVSEVVGTANVVLTGLGVVALLVSLVVATYFGEIFPKTPPELLGAIRFCLPLMAVGLWLSFMSSILGNLLAAREAIYLTNNYNLALLVVRVALTVWALSQGYGLEALIIITLSVSIVGVALLLRVARRVCGPEMPMLATFSVPRLREMWRYGVASFVSRTASTLAADSAPIIGMWLLGPEAVGIYSLALTLAQYSRRLIDQANSAIFPSVMKTGALRDLPALRSLYLRFMNISFAIGSLVFIGMMVFSQSFLGLWVGPTYEAGAVVTGILAFGYLMQSFASTTPLTLASLDKIGVTVKIGIGEAVACLALTAALPAWFGLGLAGMALGATLPRLFSNLVLYPWLAVAVMGPELRRPMLIGLAKNLGMCSALAAAFLIVHWLIPGNSWAGLIASAAVVTIGHVLLLGNRYEAFPAVERFQKRVHGTVRRMVQRREA